MNIQSPGTMEAQPSAGAAVPPEPRLARSAGKRLAVAFGSAAAVLALVAAAYARGPGMIAFVSTDNAYVKGDVTFLSPKVPGYVTAILTENNQRVRAGQTLVRIDPTDYSAALADAEAAVAQQKAALGQIAAQKALQDAQIQVADAGVISALATASKTGADYVRSDALVSEGAVSRQLFESSRAENVRARSAVSQSRAQAQYARRQVEVLDAQANAVRAQLQGAQAKLARARSDLGRADIVAPRDGKVAARNVRLGEYVNTGTRLLAITPTSGVWVEANLRETQLARIRAGDRVQVTVDAVPDVKFCGAVEGVQGASGSEFSVIAPDNASGNFTKIVRRFTVRILLDPRQAGLDRLSAGMSVEPQIAIGSHVDGRAHGGILSWLVSGSFVCSAAS